MGINIFVRPGHIYFGVNFQDFLTILKGRATMNFDLIHGKAISDLEERVSALEDIVRNIPYHETVSVSDGDGITVLTDKQRAGFKRLEKV